MDDAQDGSQAVGFEEGARRARARESAARGRAKSAREREHELAENAERATDPETGRRDRAEATVLARAAALHEWAAEVQAEHARIDERRSG